MTPRIIEAANEIDLKPFSETLLGQLNTRVSRYNLNGEGPVSELIHPAVTKCEYLFKQYPEQLDLRSRSGDYNILPFLGKSEALSQYPDIKVYSGFPHNIWQFFEEGPENALIHFEGIGAVYLSKTESFAPPFVPFLHHYTVPVFLDYALSPELWGPAGKWTRFHERLHSLFLNHGLLLDQDFPGFYPLKKEAHWLEKAGFIGQHTSLGFNLFMTWDFPLSGLVKLENALAQEP